jgi:CHAD domain-containing protein
VCLAESQVIRRADRLRIAIENAGSLYDGERLHDVRIAAKKLRCVAELRLAGRRSTADVAILKRMQDLLGRLHDLEVLIAWIREVQASLSPPDVTAWRNLSSLAHALQSDCRMLHAQYMLRRATLLAVAGRMGATERDERGRAVG